MSEVQKPVEEPVAAPAPATIETPATEPIVESATEEAPAATADVTTEAPVAEEPAAETAAEAAPAAKEVKPIEEGVLGYKGPGLLKSFIFQKKFFWFGSEPVESKHLTTYLRGEKPDVANHNAAWSAHTGKGLFYFSKKATDKASPAGIINLSEVSDVTEDGTVDFFFTISGHKHTFQAANLVDRDSWVATLKTKVAEAKEIAESVTSSETYKTSHAALLKPAVVAEPVTTETAPVEEVPVTEAPATEEVPVVAPAAEEAVSPTTPAEKPLPTKRSSIFGTLQSRFSHKKPEPEAAAPAVPAKDEEPVSENAPVIPAAESTEPLAESVEPVVPAEATEAPAVNGETKVPEAPVTKADKRKSTLPWLNKKEKSATSDDEAEKPLSPFAKLRATVKGKSSPKTEKTAEKPVEPTAESKIEENTDDKIPEEETPAAEAAPVVSEPVVAEPVAAAPVSAPQVSATA
ncbi:immunogenic protein [Rutstroemia sp. NJR-2017a BBW]|nr:immunogenic protein [Rutstroemia sp. NJR-2017a BBW]PQE08663.1 immunogenic protein [Rutstroemia sp. NJR-2017a BBW]